MALEQRSVRRYGMVDTEPLNILTDATLYKIEDYV